MEKKATSPPIAQTRFQESISNQLIQEIIKAASGRAFVGRKKPWHFIIVRDRNTLDKLRWSFPDSKVLQKASIAVVLCGDQQIQAQLGNLISDCYTASSNLVFAAYANALQPEWVRAFPDKERINELRKLLDLPEYVLPFTLIAISSPTTPQKLDSRRFRGFIHYNGW